MCQYNHSLYVHEVPFLQALQYSLKLNAYLFHHVYIFQRTNPPVLVLDETGEYLGSWGDKAITEAHGIYISNDIVYLTDRDDSVALKYTLDGKPLLVLGQRGVHSDTGCEKRNRPSSMPSSCPAIRRSWASNASSDCPNATNIRNAPPN